jgi:hypothetical protein
MPPVGHIAEEFRLLAGDKKLPANVIMLRGFHTQMLNAVR